MRKDSPTITLDSFCHLSESEAFSLLACTEQGLTKLEASERLKKYGANTIHAKGGTSTLPLFFSQFKSPVTLLLIIAALLSAILGDVTRSNRGMKQSALNNR